MAQPEFAPGLGPYRIAWRRLRRNNVALAFGGLFLLIVDPVPAGAGVLARHRPHRPERHLAGVQRAQRERHPGSGPTWTSHFFLGADTNGRDEAVRLLYGGRNSLFIGAVAMLITIVLATVLGMIAGFYRGFVDGFLSRLLRAAVGLPGGAARASRSASASRSAGSASACSRCRAVR